MSRILLDVSPCLRSGRCSAHALSGLTIGLPGWNSRPPSTRPTRCLPATLQAARATRAGLGRPSTREPGGARLAILNWMRWSRAPSVRIQTSRLPSIDCRKPARKRSSSWAVLCHKRMSAPVGASARGVTSAAAGSGHP